MLNARARLRNSGCLVGPCLTGPVDRAYIAPAS